MVGGPGVDLEHAGETIYLIWPGNTPGSPRRNWKVVLGRGMDGWMDGCFCKREIFVFEENLKVCFHFVIMGY